MSDENTISINGRTYTPDQVQQATEVITNARSDAGGSNVTTPGELRARFGQQYGGDRDIYDTLGYDSDVDADDYRARYRRQDIARRIVELPPKDTWRESPTIQDGAGDEADDSTGFAEDANELLEQQLLAYCRRADIAAGIGEYGLLFLGLADGSESLDQPVSESGEADLAYLSVFPQDQVDGWDLGKDQGAQPTDERYNRPVQYRIDFSDLDGDDGDSDLRGVHHSRVIHIAEDPVESDLKGTPRLRPVYNRLMDLEKVVGASAEMFWGGADRKYQFDVRDEFTDLPDNELESLDEEVQKLVHDMQPYIKTVGMDMNVIDGQEVDPTGVVDALHKHISGATGIPKRKLVGSEQGELASSQDRANWFDVIQSRQRNYAEDTILRPLLQRLIDVGVLSEPSGDTFSIQWPNLFELSDEEAAQVELNRAKTLKNATPQGATDMLPGGMETVLQYIEDGEFPSEEELEAMEPAAQPRQPAEEPVDEDDEDVQEQFNRLAGLADDD